MADVYLNSSAMIYGQDPDFKAYFTMQENRRNCNLLKRAMLVSKFALESSGFSEVDGVIIGSGLGAVENTEKFLKDLVTSGEELLKPSFFMQSTHNAIASTIGIYLKCNGYNSTYCQKGVSFESAVLDAFLTLKQSEDKKFFVGGFDEVSSTYHQILKKSNYLTDEYANANCGFVLSNIKTEDTFCKIAYSSMIYTKDLSKLNSEFNLLLQQSNIDSKAIDCVVVGKFNNPINDDFVDLAINNLGLSDVRQINFSQQYKSFCCIRHFRSSFFPFLNDFSFFILHRLKNRTITYH